MWLGGERDCRRLGWDFLPAEARRHWSVHVVSANPAFTRTHRLTVPPFHPVFKLCRTIQSSPVRAEELLNPPLPTVHQDWIPYVGWKNTSLDTDTKWGRFDPVNIDVAVMPKPPFLPIRSQDVDKQTCQDAYSIADVLRRLQKQGSYGGLFQMLNEHFRGYSPAAILEIPGSDVALDGADILESFKLRVVIRNDKMVIVSADRWSRQASRDVPLAIREVSLEELRRLDEAGSFGGYYVKKGSHRAATGVGSGIIGVTAAHVVPTTKTSTLLTSPSTLELTGRLRFNLPYSEKAQPETWRHLITERDDEVKGYLKQI